MLLTLVVTSRSSATAGAPASSGADATVDVALDVEPDTTVGEIVDAVVAMLRGDGVGVVDAVEAFADDGRPLDRSQPFVLAGLHAGAGLFLGGPGRARDATAVAVLEGLSGPDAGVRRVLRSGRVEIGHGDVEVALTSATTTETGWIEIGPDGALVGADGAVAAAAGEHVTVGSSRFRVSASRPPAPVDASGTVPLNRVPVARARLPDRVADPIPPPPAAIAGGRLALASLVLPVVSGVGFAAVSGRPQFLLLALLAPVALGAVMLLDRRMGRRSARRAAAEWRASVDRAVAQLERLRVDERIERRRGHPPVETWVDTARLREPKLWSRAPGVPLEVRLGTGSDRSHLSIEIAPGGDDELRDDARRRVAFASTVDGVPVVLDLSAHACAAVVGDRSAAEDLVRSLLVQLAAAHAPGEVVVAGLLHPTHLAALGWLKWLPHVRATSSPVARSHLAAWPDDADALLDEIVAVAEKRAAADETSGVRVVLVVDEEATFDRSVFGRLLDLGPSVGIHVLWVGASPELVPRQAGVVVRVDAGTAELEHADGTRRTVAVEGLSLPMARRAALALAPLRDVSAAAVSQDLPRMVGLAEVPGMPADAGGVAAAWAESDGSHLRATIGIGADGAASVDLVDDGPHALVAGTTGSGKSELLQSWVASLAAHHPPERLTFLFVDYKGGASTSVFDDLPHTVGSVTNLDPRLAQRALVSLEAELQRRMELFEGRAKDIAELVEMAPDDAPPRLVIVIDEFAELVDAVPDFVDGIVEIARIGRSLGVHVVLATQRPSGSVSNNILANTNLRLALRVVAPADSQDILGVADAAELPAHLRGRALVRVGASAIRPLQAAWSGKPVADEGRTTVRAAPFTASSAPVAEVSATSGDRTQLSVVLDAVADAARRAGGPPPRRPWVPPLPDAVPLASLWPAPDVPDELTDDQRSAVERWPLDVALVDDPGRFVRLGVRDDPRQQRNHVHVVDLETSGGLLVAGGSGSGRSTALRTAVVSCCSGASPEEVRVVVLDHASRTLAALADLPHVTEVVGGDDLDGTTLAIDVLAAELQRRRELLAAERVDRLSALRRRRGAAVLPRLLLVIDGFGALDEALDRPDAYRWNQTLHRVVAEGRALGIHTVASATRRTDVPAAVLGGIGARLVLAMPDADDMSGFGVPLDVARSAALSPGRGLLPDGTEVQVAVVGHDPDTAAQSEAVGRVAGRADHPPAPPLPRLTETKQTPPPPGPGRVPIGRIDTTLEPAIVDVWGGHVLVAGGPGSGRSHALATLAAGLRDPVHGEPRLLAVGGPRSPLAGLSIWDEASFRRGRHQEVLSALAATLPADPDDPAVVVFVDGADDVDEPTTGRDLEALAAHPAVRLVVAADTSEAGRAYGGWLGLVRRGRRILLLGHHGAQDIDQVTGVRIALRPDTPFPPGRGVLATDGRAVLVQVVGPS